MINDLVITGIPRSGTSYACTLMNGLDNTVIINEPQEIFQVLHKASCHTLKEYYDTVRNNIICGVPVQNKIDNGKYIEDTNEDDIRKYYSPEVSDPSFVFGTKNTLVYLVCMRKILQQFTDVKVLVFIRHPYDTIASWKKVSFPHLKTASPLFLKDYAGDDEIEGIDRICNTAELATRYALLWNYLATLVIRSIDNVTLFKYEAFVTDPVKCLSALYSELGVSAHVGQNISASEARKHDNVLSATEVNRIREYCGGSAGYFGYEL